MFVYLSIVFVFLYLFIVFVFLYLFIVFVFVPEVVRTHESLITNWTLKVLLSCVRPVKLSFMFIRNQFGRLRFSYKILARGEPTCPTWIGMTLDFVKRQKSIHRILCQSPVPLSRGSLSEKIILSHCKVWILSLMAFPHRSGFVVTWYFPQTCHKTQTHKHTHKHTTEKIPHTKTRVWRHGYTKRTLHTKTSFCQLKPLATITTRPWSLDMVGQTQTQVMVTWYGRPNTNTGHGHLIWWAKQKHNFMFTWYGGQARHFARTSWGNCSNCKGKGARLGQKWHW